jgi:hypothetical protein
MLRLFTDSIKVILICFCQILSKDLLDMTFINVTFVMYLTNLKVLLQMHSSLDEHLYEINYTYRFFFFFC